jgi:hypothetical protein
MEYGRCLRDTYSQIKDQRSPYPNDGPIFHGGRYLKPMLPDHLPLRERKAHG